MGKSWTYQGYPADSGLRELVLELMGTKTAELCEVVSVGTILEVMTNPDHWMADSWQRPQRRASPFWKWAEMAIKRYPDLPKFALDLQTGNMGHALHFSMSAQLRHSLRRPKPPPTDPRSWNDPISKFDEIVGHAFGSAPVLCEGSEVGCPVHLISESVVDDIGVCLATLSFEDVKQHFAEYTEIHGWESFLGWRCEPEDYFKPHEEPLDYFKEAFETFQAYFKRMANNGNYVLAVRR